MAVVSASQPHPQFDHSSLSELHGKVQSGLPAIIRQDYKAKGFKLAPDCIVIERTYISGHKVSIWYRYDNLLIICAAIGILPLIYFVARLFIGVSKAWSRMRRPA